MRGSDRAYRGALLRWLSATPGHSLREREAREMLERDAASLGPPLDDARWTRILAGLERDGLAHRSRGRLRLGYHAHQERAVGPADGPTATTLVAALRSTFGVGGYDPDPAWTRLVADAGGLP